MNEQNIMNEEIDVMEVADECVSSGSGLGGKLLGGALIAGAVFAGYKLIKKFKAKKDNKYVQVYGTSNGGEDEAIDAEVVEKLNKKLND